MAEDLFLGTTKKSWARGLPCHPTVSTSTQTHLALTVEERERLARLATLKMKAESGDKQSRRRWKAASARFAVLKTRAKGGDPRARRALGVLEESGLFGHVQMISGYAEPKDQDIIDKLILRSGNNSGWPVYISKDRYADYQSRSKKDSRAAEVVAILDRYAGEGRLKISDEKKADIVRYPIGASLCADDLEAAAYGGSSEQAALAPRLGVHNVHSGMGDRQSNALALQIAMAPTTAALYAPLTATLTESLPKTPPKAPAPDLSNQSFSSEIDRQIAEDDARFYAEQARKKEQAKIAAKNVKEDRSVPLAQKVSTDLLGLMY